jgi:hypothetical protein
VNVAPVLYETTSLQRKKPEVPYGIPVRNVFIATLKRYPRSAGEQVANLLRQVGNACYTEHRHKLNFFVISTRGEIFVYPIRFLLSSK